MEIADYLFKFSNYKLLLLFVCLYVIKREFSALVSINSKSFFFLKTYKYKTSTKNSNSIKY